MQVRCRLRRHHVAGRARRGGLDRRAPGGLPRGGGGLRDAAEPRDLQRHDPPGGADDRRLRHREQQARFIRPFLRTEELCCQLFSEPGAGSDLAGLSTSAVRDGDEWVLNGQKVWSSGARFSAWGELICRTDPSVPKHAGLTAFLLPLDTPGVEVRPIRQMSGGSSFNEVFFTDVRVRDDLRLGEVGDGWKVALATLAFERATSGSDRGSEHGGSWSRVRALAEWAGVTGDPVLRQRLAALYTLDRLRTLNGERMAAETEPGAPPGPAALDREAALDPVDERRLRRRVGDPRAAPRCRHAGSGAPTRGPSTSSAPRATGSPAAPTRSSATSSASGCSASRPSRGSTATSRSTSGTPGAERRRQAGVGRGDGRSRVAAAKRLGEDLGGHEPVVAEAPDGRGQPGEREGPSPGSRRPLRLSSTSDSGAAAGASSHCTTAMSSARTRASSSHGAPLRKKWRASSTRPVRSSPIAAHNARAAARVRSAL